MVLIHFPIYDIFFSSSYMYPSPISSNIVPRQIRHSDECFIATIGVCSLSAGIRGILTLHKFSFSPSGLSEVSEEHPLSLDSEDKAELFTDLSLCTCIVSSSFCIHRC